MAGSGCRAYPVALINNNLRILSKGFTTYGENIILLSVIIDSNKPLKMIEQQYEDRSQLLHQIRIGTKEVLKKLYDDYREMFGKWAKNHYGCSEEQAAEAYQRAFITLYYNVKNGKLTELNSSIKTYLFAVGKNMLREQFKDKHARMLPIEEEIYQQQIDTSIMQQYDEHHEKNLVKRLLDRIGEPCRTVLELFYFKQFSMEAIAAHMGYKTEQIAAKRKFICLKQLRGLLQEARNRREV